KSLPVPLKSLDCLALVTHVYGVFGGQAVTTVTAWLIDSPGASAFVSAGPGFRSWMTLPASVAGSQVLPGGGVWVPNETKVNPVGMVTLIEPRLCWLEVRSVRVMVKLTELPPNAVVPVMEAL